MHIGRDAGLAGRLSLCTGKTQGHGRIVCQPFWLDIVTTRRTISEVSRLDQQNRDISQGCLAGNRSPLKTSAYDQEIEVPAVQFSRLTTHATIVAWLCPLLHAPMTQADRHSITPSRSEKARVGPVL